MKTINCIHKPYLYNNFILKVHFLNMLNVHKVSQSQPIEKQACEVKVPEGRVGEAAFLVGFAIWV